MIKISEVAETSKRADISEKYKNIKPVEKMSDQEADDFWASEFEKIQENAEVDLHDKLLSEVFNHSEDEIDVKFDIGDRILSIIKQIKAEDWNSLDISEQRVAIKELVNTVGKELGLDKIPNLFISENEDDAYGFYDPEKNIVMLNKKYFDNSSELVNTIAHELRHVYQHMRAKIMATWEDALYKVNYENYVSPLSLPDGGWLFFTDYMNQYVEVDARAFANKFTEAIK